MGEVVEMMESGVLCKDCGDVIDDSKYTGTWTACESCEKDNEKWDHVIKKELSNEQS